MEATAATTEELVSETAARLACVQSAIADITGLRRVDFDPRTLAEAIHLLRTLVHNTPGAHATIIGGLAVQQHGFRRWTEDIDVVVNAAAYAAISDGLRAAGFALRSCKRNKLHSLACSFDQGLRCALVTDDLWICSSLAPRPRPKFLRHTDQFTSLQALTPQASFCHKQSGARIDLLREGAILKNARHPLPHPAQLGPNLGFATVPALIRLKLDGGGRMKDQLDIVELLKRDPTRIGAIGATLPSDLLPEFERLAEQARKELA